MAGCVPRLYSVPAVVCQRVRLLPALVVAAMLAGCGSMGRLDPEITGSIPTPAAAPSAAESAAAAPAPARPAAAGLPENPSDWDTVKRSVAKAAVAKKSAGRIAWTNTETGNSGTISDVIASARSGQACRNFNTTVASVGGVRLYRGEVCRGSRDAWDYVTLEPADGQAKPRDPG